MRIKKVLKPAVLLLISFILICYGVIPILAADYTSNWARDVFDEWIKAGILIPDAKGNIGPEDEVSLGELCSYINKIMGYKKAADMSAYTDVPTGYKYYNDIAFALNEGYITPESEKLVNPTKSVTREEAISAFVKIAKLNTASVDLSVLSGVHDAAAIFSGSKATMATAIENGFITGKPDYTLKPNDPITRSEVIVMLDRLNAGKRAYGFPGSYGATTGTLQTNYATIMATDVSLQNVVVARDLDITSRAADSNIALKNDVIKNKLIVNGGKNVTLTGCTVNQLELNKPDTKLIYAANGKSGIDTLVINGDNAVVDINEGNTNKKIIINGKNVTVNVGKGVKIEDVIVNGEDATINLLDSTSRLENVTLNAKTKITGKGTIGKLTVTKGGSGSEIEPKPDKLEVDDDTEVTIGGKEAGTKPRKILSAAIASSTIINVTTQDTSTYGKTISKSDFQVLVGSTPNTSFSINKTSDTEFMILFSSPISTSSQITINGINNLQGSATVSQSGQAELKEGLAKDLKTITITITNPGGITINKDNFKLTIADKDVPGFTITPVSSVSYTMAITGATLKNGTTATVSGQNGLTGTISVGLCATIKSISFNDTLNFTVNTDNTTGNTIDASCFELTIGGAAVTNFTVEEKSKTAYTITVRTELTEGKSVTVKGVKYLSGTKSETYASPFGISKVTVNSKTSITVVLAASPAAPLTSSHTSAFKVLVDATKVNVTDVVKSPTDKKNMTYTLTVNMDKLEGILTVNGVASTKDKGKVDFVAPVLQSVKLNDKPLSSSITNFRVQQSMASLIIEFSEPVFKKPPSGKFGNKDVALSGATFNIISADSTGFDVSGVKISASGNSIVINLATSKQMNPGIYTLTIDKGIVFDTAGNICGTDKVSYKFDIVGTAPMLVSAIQTPQGHLEIKLNGTSATAFGNSMALNEKSAIRVMDGAAQIGKDITYHFISYNEKAKTITVSRDAFIYENSPAFNKDTYKLVFVNDDYTAFQVSKVRIDTERPKVARVSLKNTTLTEERDRSREDMEKYRIETPFTSKPNAVLVIEFSEPVFITPPSTKLSVKDLDTFGQALMVDAWKSENMTLQGARVTATNNTVTISLANTALMNPDMYSLRIDTSLVVDASGNPVYTPVGSMLEYTFKVLQSPPQVTYSRQQTNGDFRIRFTKYSAITTEYGEEIITTGTVYIKGPVEQIPVLDEIGNPMKDEDGKVITESYQYISPPISNEYLEFNASTREITIRRDGLPRGLNGKYTIVMEHVDYDTLEIPNVSITTRPTNIYNVILTNSGDPIALNSNAFLSRVDIKGAVMQLKFSEPIYKDTSKTTLTLADLTSAVTSAFSIYDENDIGGVLAKNIAGGKAKFTVSNDKKIITIDLTAALDPTLVHHTFVFTVNETLLFDESGMMLADNIASYKFMLAQSPPKINGAAQIKYQSNLNNEADAGNFIISFEFGTELDPNKEINSYGEGLEELAHKVATNEDFYILRVENMQREAVALFKPHISTTATIDDCVKYSMNEKKLTINQATFVSQLISPVTGERIELPYGEYYIVLSHPDYVDNRYAYPIYIKTKPPTATSTSKFAVQSDGSLNAMVMLEFKESVKLTELTITHPTIANISPVLTIASSNPLAPVGGDAYDLSAPKYTDGKFKITFPIPYGESPSDYTITYKAVDVYKNQCAKSFSLDETASRHPYDLITTDYEPITEKDINGKVKTCITQDEITDFYDTAYDADNTISPLEITIPVTLTVTYSDKSIKQQTANIKFTRTEVTPADTSDADNPIPAAYSEWTIDPAIEPMKYTFQWKTTDGIEFTYVEWTIAIEADDDDTDDTGTTTGDGEDNATP